MVVSCTALLEENPKPSRNQIREGLSGNLCRCGTYQNIIEAVEHVSRKGG
jgi:carbon-monoxide dehydrogenase small subunit